MSRLPRLAPGAGLKDLREYLNLLAAAIDAGGVQNLASATDTGITGQGLSQNFPPGPGSTNVPPGSSGSPTTPTGLNLSYGIDYYSQTHDGYIVLSWTPNPVTDNIARYDIYWRKGSDPNFHQLTVGGDVNSARINSVIPGISYIFAIQAHDTMGRASTFSQEQSIMVSLDVDPPAVPTGLTATTLGAIILLTWTEVGSEGISNDLKQYQIAVSTDGGSTYPNIYTVGPGGVWSYHPTVVTTFFKIASVDWTGNVSAYSSPVSATAGGTIVGPITINPGGLTVSTNDITITAGRLVLGASASKIVPGATSLSLRNNADSADNLLITDAGIVTSRSNMVVGGNYLSLNNAGSGNPPFMFGDGTNIIWELAGAGVYQFRDSSNVSQFQITPLAATKVVPGATSLSLRNNGDTKDNLILTDAGIGTMRNALSLPPSADGTVAPTSYGTVRNKMTEVILGGTAATISISSIPTTGRLLTFEYSVRENGAGTSGDQTNIQFNGDTGANYTFGGNFTSNAGSNFPFGATNQTSGRIGFAPQGGLTAGLWNTGVLEVPNYSSTSQRRAWLWRLFRNDGSVGCEYGGGTWANSANAITSIVVIPAANSFVAGTQLICWIDY